MEKILISACLVGDNVKYNGGNNLSPKIDALLEKYELIPFCPEVEGGLSVPRTPAERIGDKVINQDGEDVTDAYMKGAELAFNICLFLKIKKVILKQKSPSCGSKIIYDGTFSHKEIKGMGVTAEYLKKKGIEVFSEDDIDSLL
ncbi:MAG: DUF523 domain-containing protein [Bacilli bacterium]|nr:DUF523 domain-containing protein [Bacilli bacterium]